MNIIQYFSRLFTTAFKCVVFSYNYFPRQDSMMSGPISSCHQEDQHADPQLPECGTSFDQEKHLLFGASVYTASSYKHNCTRGHSASHTSLITTSLRLYFHFQNNLVVRKIYIPINMINWLITKVQDGRM